MPNHAGKVIAKPPPGRDVVRPQTGKRPIAIPPKEVEMVTPGREAAKPKSKEEKVYDMHLRKLRSLAKALDTGRKGEGEKRFFECAVDEMGEGLSRWGMEGKWDGKVERVWVMVVCCFGWSTAALADVGLGYTLWEIDGSHDQLIQGLASKRSLRSEAGSPISFTRYAHS